jgi:U4/U6.U5 tri-snRNP-associated protein 2
VPLHKNESEKVSIPHIPIFDLLKKFDGITNKDSADGRRKFKIRKFPKYLIIHMRRFTMNNFFMEKNSTIVSFPLNSLDLKPCKEYNYIISRR